MSKREIKIHLILKKHALSHAKEDNSPELPIQPLFPMGQNKALADQMARCTTETEAAE